MCFIRFVTPFWHIDFDYRLLRLSDLEIGLKAGETGQHGMIIPPGHLIPSLMFPGVRLSLIFTNE
jgi:hypothetical protein